MGSPLVYYGLLLFGAFAGMVMFGALFQWALKLIMRDNPEGRALTGVFLAVVLGVIWYPLNMGTTAAMVEAIIIYPIGGFFAWLLLKGDINHARKK